MDLSELIRLNDEYLTENQNDPHLIASFKQQIDQLLNKFDVNIPFEDLDLNELIESRNKFESALKNVNSLSNEVLLRHQLRDIEERISAYQKEQRLNRKVII